MVLLGAAPRPWAASCPAPVEASIQATPPGGVPPGEVLPRRVVDRARAEAAPGTTLRDRGASGPSTLSTRKIFWTSMLLITSDTTLLYISDIT